MEKVSDNIKCARLKKQLSARIESGEFPFGTRFPGLHDLCKEYNLSYVTVCKAVKLLEAEGYLRRKLGVGYFVCFSNQSDTAAKKEVNIISTAGFYENNHLAFGYGMEIFKKNGWKINLLLHHDLYELKNKINAPDTFSIITAFNVDWERFSATFGQIVRRVVVLGRLSGNPEITSIVADEVASVKLCMDHFATMGRKKVALASLLPRSELGALRIAAWRSLIASYGLSPEWMRRHLLSLENFSESWSSAEQYIRQWMEKNLADTDAIILPAPLDDFMGTLRALDISFPERLAVTTIGSKPGFAEKYPGVFTLDNNFAGHFRCALDILEDRFVSGASVPGSWYFCQPVKVITSK